jgi:hypothetical protein
VQRGGGDKRSAMLTSNNVRNLDDEGLDSYDEEFTEIIERDRRRVAALRRTKAKRPRWSFYDEESDTRVTLDMCIDVFGSEAAYYEDMRKVIRLEKERRQGVNQTIPMF